MKLAGFDLSPAPAPAPPMEVVELLGWRFERAPGQPPSVEAQPGYWAMRMATASRLAYRNPDPAMPGLLHAEPGSLRFFDRGSTQALGYRSEGHLCLVFRGSQEPDDFVVDAMAWLQGEPALHLGFQREWRRVRSEVLAWLAVQARDPLPLVLAGHSLGGALAIVAACQLSAAHPVAGVFTYGAPRVGSHAFAAHYAGRPSATAGLTLDQVTRQFRHADDPVAIVPPPVIYSHVGQAFSLQSGGLSTLGPRWVPGGLAQYRAPDASPLAALGEAAVAFTQGSVGARILAVEDWMFAATPWVAVLLALGGFGLLALSEHWADALRWVTGLGRFKVLQAVAALASVAMLQQLTYLRSGLCWPLRWLLAAGLFAGAWSQGWAGLVAGPVLVGAVVLFILLARLMLPYAGDHAMGRYEQAFWAPVGPGPGAGQSNHEVFTRLGLEPVKQAAAAPNTSPHALR